MEIFIIIWISLGGQADFFTSSRKTEGVIHWLRPEYQAKGGVDLPVGIFSR